MTEKTEQDQVTNAAAEEPVRVAIRMFVRQISRNKYFAHVWPRWSNTGSVLGVSSFSTCVDSVTQIRGP